MCHGPSPAELVLRKKKDSLVPGWWPEAVMASTAPGTYVKLNVLTTLAAVLRLATVLPMLTPL